MIKKILFGIHKKIEIDLCELRYLFLEITSKCNLSCLHCGSDCSSFQKGNELSEVQWFDFIDHVKHHFPDNRIVVVLTGGEPMMRADIGGIIRKIAVSGYVPAMVSNGYLLSRDKIDELIRLGLRLVTVSLDGLEDAHNYLRNTSERYEALLENIRYLAERGVLSDVVTCINRKNIRELDRIAESLISLNVKRWRLFSIIAKGRAANNPELVMSSNQWGILIDWIKINRKKYMKKGLTLDFSCEGYFKSSIESKIRTNPFFCRAGINVAGILNDGSITACPNISRKFIQGNILYDDFSEIWKNEYDLFRNRNLIRNERCYSCGEWEKCKGSSMHLYDDEFQLASLCHYHDIQTC